MPQENRNELLKSRVLNLKREMKRRRAVLDEANARIAQLRERYEKLKLEGQKASGDAHRARRAKEFAERQLPRWIAYRKELERSLAKQPENRELRQKFDEMRDKIQTQKDSLASAEKTLTRATAIMRKTDKNRERILAASRGVVRDKERAAKDYLDVQREYADALAKAKRAGVMV